MSPNEHPLQRILLVEDDPDIRVVAELTLKVLGGFELKVCPGGHEALEQAEGFKPDLILLDVMMPGMDGPTTLGELRKRPSLADVPVVFMTAKVQPSEVAQLKALGAIEVVPKPFDPASLPSQLREIWSRHSG
jgi:two-component system OmpR family response regulator